MDEQMISPEDVPSVSADGGTSTAERLKALVRENGREFLDFLIPFCYDLLKGVAILVGLLTMSGLLRLAKLFGFEERYVSEFETLHYWASYATYAVLSFAFLLRLILTSFVWRGKRVF